jgi:PIN domain nuclease of toxin-antitoxin system
VKLLLDTHCLIWVLTDAPELSASSRSVIANAEGVWFSEASIWELGLKWRKGKIAVRSRRLADQAFANGLRPLPIQMEPLLVSCELRQSHGDPFDRLLYAQARHAGFRLLSIDRSLFNLWLRSDHAEIAKVQVLADGWK